MLALGQPGPGGKTTRGRGALGLSSGTATSSGIGAVTGATRTGA